MTHVKALLLKNNISITNNIIKSARNFAYLINLIYLYIYLSISFFLCILLYIFLFIYLSIYFSLYLSIYKFYSIICL